MIFYHLEERIEMFRNIHWPVFLKHGLIAAIVYCVPVFVFIKHALFGDAWVLYLGNFLFLIVVVVFLIRFNDKKNDNASSVSMFAAGHLVTAIGIVMSCLICFILLVLLIPGLLHSGQTEKILRGTPANSIHDKTNGLAFMVFANAIIGNIATGSFVSIVFPFSLKSDQTTEKVTPKQVEL